MLAEHFVKKYSEANDIPIRRISDEARARLRAHAWLGNVRELENTLHRAVLLASGDAIGPEAITLSGATRNEPREKAGEGGAAAAAEKVRGLVGRTVADVERDLIIDTLSHCLGNRTHAATILGISIRTLRNKLKQYSDEGMRVPPARDGERLSA
jgi:two-component system response regulator FlrC